MLSDEPAINLAEVDVLEPTGVGNDTDWYRVQKILIFRDGEPTLYRERLGLSKKFKRDPFRIMGGMIDGDTVFADETVGTLKEMANQMREEVVNFREMALTHGLNT